MILGAILAGGQSRRFGSDKALAEVAGRPMLAHVVEALAAQSDALVIVGRDWPGVAMLADDPPGRFGPLAGLNAALSHAAAQGYAGVLSVPVDVLPVPESLRVDLIGDGPAVYARQHLIGWWPAALAPRLAEWVATGNSRFGDWIEAAGTRRVPEPVAMRNINRLSDLSPPLRSP